MPAKPNPKRPRRIPQPVVLVTGASQGIGAAIARVFAEAKVGPLALVARNRRNLEAVARRCRALGAPQVEVFCCDCSDATQVEEMAADVLSTLGRVDVLVNNAGAYAGKPFLELSVEEFDACVAANLRSLFLVSKFLIPQMAERGSGDVFNMGSVASLRGFPNGAAYCAAKAGVLGLTRVLREELRSKGVRVSCVMPGATWSPSWHGAGVPEERMMPDADIARAFLDLYRLGRNTVVEEIVLRPMLGDL